MAKKEVYTAVMTAQESKLQEFTADLQSESGRKNCFRIACAVLKNDAGNDVSDAHQTDIACAWLVCHSQEGLCKLYPPYPASQEARAPSFLGKPVMRPRIMAVGAPAPCGRVQSRTKTNTKTLLHTLTKYTNSQVQPSQSSSLSPAHSPPNSPMSNPLCKTHPHTTEHLFNCTHLYTSSNILDLWMSPRRGCLC